MKVLLVNKFYKRSGGDCIHFRALEDLLRSGGHAVAVLTMHHPQNDPLPPCSFEAPSVDISGSITGKIKAASRILGGASVRDTVAHAIDSFRPDIVHLHNIHSYLSPAVAEVAHARGIPVVWTLHDYKLICGAYTCMRNEQPCTECIDSPTAILRHKCMKNSVLASALAFAEARKWNKAKLSRITDCFICPSSFMKSRMEQAGFAPDRLNVLPNFVPSQAEYMEMPRSGVCYVGRLSPEKGLNYLLNAAELGGWQLTVAGSGPQEQQLKNRYEQCANISFVGQLNADEVADLLRRSSLSVVPSVWFENNPLAAIESLCLGTPVAASAIGGLPELINDSNGMLFEPRNPAAINDAVQSMLTKPYCHSQIAREAQSTFSADTYLKKLSAIYRCY